MTPPLAPANLQTLGVSGLRESFGVLQTEWLPELRGDRWLNVVEEMLTREPVIGGIRWAVESLIRGVDWSINPADKTTEAADVADFVDEVLFQDLRPDWQDTITDHLSMLWYGWSWSEINWKQRNGPNRDPSLASNFDDGRIGIRSIALRAQSTRYRWEFDANGEVKAMIQRDPNSWNEIEIPIEKSLHFRVTSNRGSPEGYSFLRNSYEPWMYKKRLQALEALGVERDLAGVPVAWVPLELFSSRKPEDRATFAQIQNLVTSLKRDEQEGIVWPMAYDQNGNKVYDLTLLTTGGQRQQNTDQIIQRHNASMAMPLLADFILLGHEKVGSYALSSNKTDLFAVGLGSILNKICLTYNTDLIPRLCRLNGIDQEIAPTLVAGDIETLDLVQLSTFVKDLVTAGAINPTPQLERYLLEQAKMPVPDEEQVDDAELPTIDEGVTAPEPTAPPVPPVPPQAAPAQAVPAAAIEPKRRFWFFSRKGDAA